MFILFSLQVDVIITQDVKCVYFFSLQVDVITSQDDCGEQFLKKEIQMLYKRNERRFLSLLKVRTICLLLS